MPDGAHFPLKTATAKPDRVRIAGPADEAVLFDLCMRAHAEDGVMSVSLERTREWIGIFLNHPADRPYCVAGVIDAPDGSLAACMVVMLAQRWYSDDFYVNDLLTFVHPDHRLNGYEGDLLNFSKWLAESLHLPAIIGVTTIKRAQAKSRLFRAYFGQPCGEMFVHNRERA